MASTFAIKLVLFLAISFSNSLIPIPLAMPAASPNLLSFSLTHRDADSSPLRSVEADPADLPADMPMRAFVAAGRALRTRVSMKRQQQLILKAKGVPPSLRLGRRISFGGSSVGDFYITVSVGTPTQKMIWLLDTGSEFSWLECSPCSGCGSTTAPRFAYKKSSSFHAVSCESSLCRNSVGVTLIPSCNSTAGAAPAQPCSFGVGYVDGSGDYGFVSVDTFDVGPRRSKPFVFGCASNIVNQVGSSSSSGLLGLDLGPYSFTSQLFSSSSWPRRVPKKFAYWLPDRVKNSNAVGRIEFGNYKSPRGIRYTPLTPPFSPMGASYYYVNLEGITVGRSLIKADTRGPHDIVGAGGTVFDSGAALSYLTMPLYGKLVEEMTRQTAHLRPFSAANTTLESDLCYKLPAKTETLPDVPRVIIHFARGVDLELEPNSVLYGDRLPGDNANVYLCLAFKSSVDNENLIGNYQGQNYWAEYNLDTFSLGLAKATSAHL